MREAGEVTLVDVYSMQFDEAAGVLYSMLAQRAKAANISHKKMPSFLQHCEFVRRRPYRAWWLVSDGQPPWVGQAYLTQRYEIGIQILDEHQRRGYATSALRLAMSGYTGPFYANINPHNRKSIAFFRKHGFEIIQSTYKLDASAEAQL